jgi:hypothetical protein
MDVMWFFLHFLKQEYENLKAYKEKNYLKLSALSFN